MSRSRRKKCATGKTRWPDKLGATRALHRLQNRSGREAVPVRVYECPRCKGWHLTSEPKR